MPVKAEGSVLGRHNDVDLAQEMRLLPIHRIDVDHGRNSGLSCRTSGEGCAWDVLTVDEEHPAGGRCLEEGRMVRPPVRIAGSRCHRTWRFPIVRPRE